MKRLKLYEPPIDDGDDDEDELSWRRRFVLCLLLGGSIATGLMLLAQ